MDNGPFSRVRSESEIVRNWRYDWFSLPVQPPLKHDLPSQTFRVHVDECCGLATVRWVFRRTRSCTGGDSPTHVLFRKNDFDFQRPTFAKRHARPRRRTDLTWPGGVVGFYVENTNQRALRPQTDRVYDFLLVWSCSTAGKRGDCPRRKNCAHNFVATYWFERFFFVRKLILQCVILNFENIKTFTTYIIKYIFHNYKNQIQ